MGNLYVIRTFLMDITIINESLTQEPLTMFITPYNGSNKASHSVNDRET